MVYRFVGSNLWVQRFLKMRKHQKKAALKQKIEASLQPLFWGFKKITFTLYTYVLSKILKNGAKFIQKLTPGLKNHMRNLNNFRQAVESPINTLKFDGILSKKYIPSTKTYTEDLSNITFNYLCENSPNYSCHFRNPKSFFTTQLLCIFLAQTLHSFYKSSPSKCKFSDWSRYVES